MKYIKTIIALLFVVLIIVSLLYKNLIAPDDKDSMFFQIADMAIPLTMVFSVFMMFLKRRDEKKEVGKLSEDDRKFFHEISKKD